MKKFVTVFLVIITLTSVIMAKPRPNSPYSSSSTSSTCTDELCSGIAEVLVEVLAELSYYNNIMASFDNYPYATRSNYIDLNEDSNPQFYRFTLDTSAFYTPGFNTFGNGVRFEGYIWKFFGPVFENQIAFDGNDNLKYGKMDLGMQFSIFQLSLCSLLFDIKWEHLYGNNHYNGTNLGFVLRSYPVKPLIIEYRANWGLYSDSADKIDPDTGIRRKSTFQSHLELGTMTNSPVEIYTFWDYTIDGFIYRKANAIGMGAKYQF